MPVKILTLNGEIAKVNGKVAYEIIAEPPGPVTYADWFLPSRGELIVVYDRIVAQGVGSLPTDEYCWTSSAFSPVYTYGIIMSTGNLLPLDKNLFNGRYALPVRSFTDTDLYNIRDAGPAGGWIFIKEDIGGGLYTYYEVAPAALYPEMLYSNTTELTQNQGYGQTIGDGYSNSIAVTNQAGHTASAALSCLNYSVTV